MPRLYCEKHGREYELDAAQRQQEYRREGETVLIVRGTLRSGPWLCDRCNAALARGKPALLASFLPAWITEQTDAYDFAYEREYFSMKEATVTVYGAPWRAMKPGANGGVVCTRNTSARRRQREPLCALDLFVEQPPRAD